MKGYDRSLNAEQLEAVCAEGNVLLLACPGSGKTRTLIEKIARELTLIPEHDHRQQVVALTYTHVAADEIRERVSEMGISVDQLWVGTLHSFCLEWIIRPYAIYHESLRSGFRIADTYDQEELLDSIAKRHGLKNRYDCDYLATSAGYVLGKNVPHKTRSKVWSVINEYHEQLTANKAIDFEMLLMYSFELIKRHPPIAQRLSQLFRLIAVDEYQDTREIQYQILANIFRAEACKTRLFMVGDPNQAIFTSLGGFAISYEDLVTLTGLDIQKMSLQQNYRSSQKIVGYFSQFGVEPVDIVASGTKRQYNSLLTYNKTIHRDELIDYVGKLVRHNVEVLGIKPSQICIVAPWWVHLSSVTRALVEKLPEYEFSGPGLTPFGQNRDNFWYKVSRIALTESSPNHYFTRLRWAQEILDLLLERHHLSEPIEPRDFLRLTNGISIDEVNGVRYLEAFFDQLLCELGIELREDDEIKQQLDSFFNRMCNRIKRIHSTERVDISDLRTFQRVFRPRSGIVVSTVHGIKGTEFDTVIGFALYEGAIPHFSENGNVAAAKRSLFVIGSRARKNLHLISERGRKNYRGVEYPPTHVLANTQYEYSAFDVVSI